MHVDANICVTDLWAMIESVATAFTSPYYRFAYLSSLNVNDEGLADERMCPAAPPESGVLEGQ